MVPFFAMLPDMDEPTPEFIGPPTKLLRFGIDPAKPGKSKSVKARKVAKPKAKDAKPKRRRKVSAR